MDSTSFMDRKSSYEWFIFEFQVSGSAVAQVIRRNLGLKCFIARDCRNFLQEESKSVTEKSNAFSYHYSELYYELGKSCQLEEIAVGWGFSFFSLEVLRPAIRMLKTIIIGLGGSFGEDGLKMLPTLCPWLETLILYFQVIYDCYQMLKGIG